MAFSLATTRDMYYAPPGRPRAHHGPKITHKGTTGFIGVDGEGITLPTGEHRYVLLGVGDEQIDDPAGLKWWNIFDFLYAQRQRKLAMCGFYLGYDFTQWIKTFPEERARRLLTIDGRESRRSKSPALRGKFLPVDLEDWQVDMLGSKRMMIRPRVCECVMVKCPHKQNPWLYINDAGPFFQTSFLNVIDPRNWETPIVTDEEYATVREGKERRETAVLDMAMRRYNVLENELLARALTDLDKGFRGLDITLQASQWYGPGQASQAWMTGKAPTSADIAGSVPAEFTDAARMSYFGGWFEQQAHGIIPGVSYEYDINSAYPYVIANLPCLLHGVYTSGHGKPVTRDGDLCLVRATVWGRPPLSDPRRDYVGAMLHRDNQGHISRPIVTAGWYWLHELQAARRAGLISTIRHDRYHEWRNYSPCDCLPPLRRVRNLYQLRLDVGKKTSLGKAAKLCANSAYGKTAQSIGQPKFANPVYASLITAGCRVIIYDAIATHPGGKAAVVMVATDAVFFLDAHPSLTIGTGLGEWDREERRNLTLFKPGVYWDDDARERIRDGEAPQFKARGVSARDFATQIAMIDDQFDAWGDTPPPIIDPTRTTEERLAQGLPIWPKVTFTAGFAMTTALQALVRNEWATAGHVTQGKPMVQSANPSDKRATVYIDDTIPGRRLYRSQPWMVGGNVGYKHANNLTEWDKMGPDRFDSVPYEKRFGLDDPFSDESSQAFGISPDEHQPMRGAFRFLTGQER